ncbi:allophanate hydrolase subunit 1 [Pseudomonas sp.]|uniref:5-oxoprolinase subunit B family protein n=1 Tax=Pseudomonas sp. TaxID=306 RepID=UPI00248760B3|nr:allophanate hydrolase subunit 1 [Pseudomonas sp.]MDI1332504.1 allophanate hydrolase subunit 1 [Pseudomonas sp.]
MKLVVEVASIDSLIVRLFDDIDESNMPWLIAATLRIREVFGDWLIDVVPSYTTVLIQYDITEVGARKAREIIFEALDDLQPIDQQQGRRLVVPVWYDLSVGPELKLVSHRIGKDIHQIIALHSEREYCVFALGFSPGYAYMGLLDELLSTPRLSTPRKRVSAGSVAIAERQTTTYPQESPGGWNVLGRTPSNLFDRTLEGYSLLQPGDRVRFEPIGRSEFVSLGGDDTPLEAL